jgi:DNA-binding XRE family transcriptional regulator/mannose-6-phosphate isomerase-like protein (cupin superfamily)
MGTDVNLAAIGQRLRGARETRGLTLDQLAALAGLSKAHLSRLESGERQPSIGVLVDLTSALGTRISTLLGEDIGGSPLATYGRDVPRHDAGGLEIASCSGYPDSHALEALRVTVTPNRQTTPPVRHRGEEWLYVQRGTLELEYDGVLYEIPKDASVHFDANRPHRMTTRRVPAEILLVTAEDRTELSQIRH